MNGAAGRRVYGFSSTDETVKSAPSRPAASSRAPASVELDRVGLAQRPVLGEVAPLRDASSVDRGEARGEGARFVGRDDVPVLRGDELHPLALAFDDEPRRDRLNAAGREPLHDLPPEHRRDLVAVQPVEDAARLLRVDEPVVDLARLAERALDRRPRDLVEDHPPDRHLRVEHLAQVPGDRLALAIFVRREQQLVGVLELRLQVGDDLLLARVDDVERLEVLVDVRRRGGPTSRPSAWPGSPRRCSAGRGCGRSTTRPGSRSRDSRRSSSPSRATRRSRASCRLIQPFRAPP